MTTLSTINGSSIVQYIQLVMVIYLTCETTGHSFGEINKTYKSKNAIYHFW